VAVSGLGVAMAASGVVLMLSGVRNQTVKDTLTDLLKGQVPAENATGAPTISVGQDSGTSADNPAANVGGLAGGDTGASSAAAAANQAAAKLLAAPYGWATGQQWTDLVSLWNRESGWSTSATNPSSGAFGIAQALGHGTSVSAGTVVIDGTTHNEYPNTLANNGDAVAQIAWGLNYIQVTYGSPAQAWAHELSEGWY